MTEDIELQPTWHELRRWWLAFSHEQREELAACLDEVDAQLVAEVKAEYELTRQRVRWRINTARKRRRDESRRRSPG